MIGVGLNNSSAHKFVAYNAAGQAWNGASFENWADADFSSYGIASTRNGTTTTYVGTLPAGAAYWQLWYWTGTLATSYPVYDDTITLQINVQYTP